MASSGFPMPVGPPAGADAPRVIVVGARSARQGTGPYVARWLQMHGAEVCAIVGTQNSTVQQAQRTLRREYDITCRGYTDLATALTREQADAAAICSPSRFHAEHLEVTANAGLHCLCEKPLCWSAAASHPAGSQDAHDPLQPILDAFDKAGRLLQLITQWPATLPAFDQLHPGGRRSAVEHFAMRLSPISTGLEMIADAGPHFLSMLIALCGPGELERIDVAGPAGSPDQEPLVLNATYRHAAGQTAAELRLQRCLTRPRPAWYAVNGSRVDRQVTMPDYHQSLVAGGREVALADPMEAVVKDFLHALRVRRATDRIGLRCQQWNLRQLAAAVINRR